MSHDWAAVQVLAHEEFATRLEAVSDWHAPTPDAEWDVQQLVRHVVDEQRWVPLLLRGTPLAEARRALPTFSTDLRADWREFSAKATDAWQAVTLETRVELSHDTVTAHEYLVEQTSDVIIHTWDLARAVGADEELPDALVEAAWSYFGPLRETLVGTGLFGDPVDVGDDAPLRHRLLALTGRDPR